MKEIRKYIADDGKEFNNRYDCEEYEQAMRLNHFGNDLQFYDNRKNPTTNYTDAYYIIARTEAAKDAIDDLAEEYNFKTPWDDTFSARKSNAWYWDEDFDEWRSYEELKERQEELTSMLTAFNFWLNE